MEDERQANYESRRLLAIIVSSVLFFIQILLIGLRVDERIGGLWATVFIPVWVWFVVAAFCLLFVAYFAIESDGVYDRKHGVIQSILGIVTVALLFAFFVLLVEKLDDVITPTRTALTVVIPLLVLPAIWIVFGIFIRSISSQQTVPY